MSTTMEKITIYSGGGMFGIHKTEAKLIAHGKKPLAQYTDAPFVHFIEKGKRTPKGIQMGYNPFILILKGHGHPDPDSPFVEQDIGETGMVCKKSRYASCDPRYVFDFNLKINPYLSVIPHLIVADYRHTKAVQS